MSLFSPARLPNSSGRRLTGLSRFLELIERDLKKFLLVNLLTLLGLLPFALGVLTAILTSSVLILIPACVLGGLLAGPSLACMYDCIFRSLRDAPGTWRENYRRAWHQNWRQALLPGVLFCLLLGFYAFMLALFWWAAAPPGFGTLAVYLAGLLIITLFFLIYWPLLVLFEQTGIQRFKNCVLFVLRFFWRALGCALLELLYWTVTVLFLPWSLLTLLLLGLWFILLGVNFLLYDTLNGVFGIEEQIAENFPEQAAFYEDDAAWLKRKQEEER